MYSDYDLTLRHRAILSMLLGTKWGRACSHGPRATQPSFPTRLSRTYKATYADKTYAVEITTSVNISTVNGPLVRLFEGVRAHESSLSSAIVLQDKKNGEKVVVTSALDKTIAAWRLVPNEDPTLSRPFYCEVQKIAAPGGPIFSIAPSRPLFDQPVPKPAFLSDGRGPVTTIFCGNAAKEVISWQPFMPVFNPLRMGGHTSWVRSVATYDKYLFSCGCKHLRQWDCTYATPKQINQVEVQGDILVISAGGGFVHCAGADGRLHSWSLDKATGALAEVAVRELAHDGRICGLARHEGFLYSCGVDGSIKMWKQGTLELVAEAHGAHESTKVYCMAIAGNGVMYTGGEDKLIRAWDPSTLEPLQGFEPLQVHSGAVRMLMAGKSELLISGDSTGFVNFFRVPAAPEPMLPPEVPDFADLSKVAVPAASTTSRHKNSSCREAAGLLCSCSVLPGQTLSASEFSDSLSPQPAVVEALDADFAAAAAEGASLAAEGESVAAMGRACTWGTATTGASMSPISREAVAAFAAALVDTASDTGSPPPSASLYEAAGQHDFAAAPAAVETASPPAAATSSLASCEEAVEASATGIDAAFAAAATSVSRKEAAENAAAATAAKSYREVRIGSRAVVKQSVSVNCRQ